MRMLPPHNPQTDIKLSVLKKYLPLLASVPYTRLIFLSGSAAAETARPESDIDLVIVSQKNRVWLNRIFSETAAWLISRRRTKTKFKDRFCFNMFLADNSPLLPHRDIVAAACCKNLKPVWANSDYQIKNFWRANGWIEKFYPITLSNQQTILPVLPPSIKIAKTILEKFLDWSGLALVLEKISFRLQSFYLKREFDLSGGAKNRRADFFVSPSLIAYHFPVSNYHRQAQKWRI